eukprot:SAG31_NODE_7102_length_1788_cov_1.198342_2_plen_112_part_00
MPVPVRSAHWPGHWKVASLCWPPVHHLSLSRLNDRPASVQLNGTFDQNFTTLNLTLPNGSATPYTLWTRAPPTVLTTSMSLNACKADAAAEIINLVSIYNTIYTYYIVYIL